MARESLSMRTIKTNIAGVKEVLTHPKLALILRIYIGGLFVYASIHKINNPAEFAEAIAGYQIVPYWGVGFLSVILPWIELFCGTFLLVGFRSKSASLFLSLMLISFSMAIALSLLRGISIGCGCFDGQGEEMNWWSVGRDIIWLLMTIHVYYLDKTRLGLPFHWTPN
jgi:putative oxidoreductase